MSMRIILKHTINVSSCIIDLYRLTFTGKNGFLYSFCLFLALCFHTIAITPMTIKARTA